VTLTGAAAGIDHYDFVGETHKGTTEHEAR